MGSQIPGHTVVIAAQIDRDAIPRGGIVDPPADENHAGDRAPFSHGKRKRIETTIRHPENASVHTMRAVILEETAGSEGLQFAELRVLEIGFGESDIPAAQEYMAPNVRIGKILWDSNA